MLALFLIALLCACSIDESSQVMTSKPIPVQRKVLQTVGSQWQYPAASMTPVLDQDDPQFKELQQQLFRGEHRAAAIQLSEFLKEQPNHAGAHSLMSVAMINLGDGQQAEQAALKVVELVPSALAYCNLASVLLANEKWSEAMSAYEMALELDSKSFLALRNLGSLAYRSRDLAKAEKIFRRLLRYEPNDSYVYVSLAQIYSEQGKYSEAEDLYQYRVQEMNWWNEEDLQNDSAFTLELLIALGEVLRIQQKNEEAIHWFKKVIQHSERAESSWTAPGVYKALAHLRWAKSSSSLGDEEEALKQFQAANGLVNAGLQGDQSVSEWREIKKRLENHRREHSLAIED